MSSSGISLPLLFKFSTNIPLIQKFNSYETDTRSYGDAKTLLKRKFTHTSVFMSITFSVLSLVCFSLNLLIQFLFLILCFCRRPHSSARTERVIEIRPVCVMEMLMKFCSPFIFFDSGQNLLLSNYTFFLFFFFSITPKDGRIFTHGELDREEIENYEILVVAQDNGSPPLSGKTFMDIGQTDRQTNFYLK